MKTLTIAIQKGGQGKTFATTHLAFGFAQRGLRVAVVDFDVQANASYTLEASSSGLLASDLFIPDAVDRIRAVLDEHASPTGISLIAADTKLANLDAMSIAEASAVLRQNLAVLSPYFDVTLIDTAPSLGIAMTSALLVSSHLLSPVEMEAYSLQGLAKLMTVVRNTRAMNPGLEFIGMLPNKVDARKRRHLANLDALRTAYPTLVLPMQVGARDSIAEALGDRKPVWQIKRTAARAAAKEVRALADYVATKMQLKVQ